MPHQVTIQPSGHQFTVNVDPYLVPGNPGSGLLPYIQAGDGGTPGAADTRMQAYNYRMCLTNNSATRIPIHLADTGQRSRRNPVVHSAAALHAVTAPA